MLATPAPLLVLAVLIAVADRGSCNAKWGYKGEFAPYNWVNVDTSPNVNQCGDKLQSPVDLDDRYAEYEPGLTEITFSGYDQELYNPYIVNNGHTVQVSATEDSNRYIEGARLPGRFQFAQFHLHWGANSSRGSEHTVRGFQYPLELHFVHFNAKYGSAAEAMKYQDGLAVIAVFFEVSPTANDDMSVLVDALKEVRLSDEKGFNLQRPVVLNRFLPRITRSYFRYLGSLTTPPCSQAVTFTVMTTTVPISEEQLQQFRLLRAGKDENSSTMVDNFRPTFPLNGRRVFKSFPSSATRPGLGPEGFPSLQDADDSYAILSESGFDDRFRNPNRKPSGDRGGNRRQQQGGRPSSRPQGSSRPGGSSSSSGSRGPRPNPGRGSSRVDGGGSSRPRDFPRNDDGPRDSSRNDRGPSRSRGDSPSRPRESSRPRDRDRESSSTGRRPQPDDDSPPRRQGSRDEEGFRGRPKFSRGTPTSGHRSQHGDASPPRRQSTRDEEGFRGRPEFSRGPGHRPQHDDDSPSRHQGTRDEEGFRGRPELSHANSPSGHSPRGPNRPEEFPHHESVPGPEDFAVPAGHRQRPRGNSQTQGFQGPEPFLTPQQSRGPQRFPEVPQRNTGPEQFPGPERLPVPDRQPFPRDQGFAGGSLETSLPEQVSRSQEFPRRQEFPDGYGVGLGGLPGPGRG